MGAIKKVLVKAGVREPEPESVVDESLCVGCSGKLRSGKLREAELVQDIRLVFRLSGEGDWSKSWDDVHVNEGRQRQRALGQSS